MSASIFNYTSNRRYGLIEDYIDNTAFEKTISDQISSKTTHDSSPSLLNQRNKISS